MNELKFHPDVKTTNRIVLEEASAEMWTSSIRFIPWVLKDRIEFIFIFDMNMKKCNLYKLISQDFIFLMRRLNAIIIKFQYKILDVLPLVPQKMAVEKFTNICFVPEPAITFYFCNFS